ncbi:MAG: Peptide transporter ATP-binding protein [Devosia sp.]|uniref:ATP-binding cassette domain-containing protein n=1 Tax=Devosia sp. TaxID=1871048 RepID=UPI00262ECEB0|nr:dipeptide/oligopeptide/nickel ABC transporter ATP-binding protein [Devosia sp.]MDB5539138.1 Peptide transporter ATP-binding protein [Devosia sp.]
MSTVTPFPAEVRPLLEVRQLSQVYHLNRQNLFGPRPTLKVLDTIDFAVRPGEAVGLVGESGSGKTTLTRMLTGVEKPREGQVLYDGVDVWLGGEAHRKLFRRSVQVVLQNPRSSLDPRMRVGTSLLEPLRSLRIEGDHAARVLEVLDQVGLDKNALERFPHEFSGGQLQRIAIARALMPGPKVLIADEPVSALDVSIQAQVLNLLKDLVKNLGLGLVFIAHDLSVVAYTTSRVSVMSAGKIVEVGKPLDLFNRPQADATKALVGAILSVESGLAGNALA